MEIFFEFINPYRAWIMTIMLAGCLAGLIYVCMDIFGEVQKEIND